MSSDTKAPGENESAAIDPFDPKSFQQPANMTAGANAGEASPLSVPGITQVKLLVFDMGHVFVDFDWDEVCNGFCARASISRDEFKKVLAYLGGLGYERGQISTSDFLRELNLKLGTTLNLEEFRVLWNVSFHENPDMATLLQGLRTRLPLYLLSNTNEEHYGFLQTTFNVARHFQERILSYEVGCAKPDHSIYHEVLKRSGLPAAHHLFVDDLEPNVKAAQAVGMQAIRFSGIDNLKQQLQAHGIAV